MRSVTRYEDGTIRLSLADINKFTDTGWPDDRLLIDCLTSKGYIVIDANHVAYCHYVSGECPHCGRPAERPSP